MRFIKFKNNALINVNEIIMIALHEEGTKIVALVNFANFAKDIVIYKGNPRVVDLVYRNLTSELSYDDNSPDIGALAERATKAIEMEEVEK